VLFFFLFLTDISCSSFPATDNCQEQSIFPNAKKCLIWNGVPDAFFLDEGKATTYQSVDYPSSNENQRIFFWKSFGFSLEKLRKTSAEVG